MFKQSDKVIVVGSAPSLLDITPLEIFKTGATVIAVNGAIEWLKKADYWFTLDPQPRMIRLMRNQVEGCNYVMCGPEKVKTPLNVTRLKRNEGSAFGWVRGVLGLSEDTGSINTGNSGYGGLGLAYHMQPSKILILGIDASDAQQVDGDFPGNGKLEHLPALFASTVEQINNKGIDVVVGSKHSGIKCFKRMTPKEGLQWIVK